jgi:hypothetical protein
MSALAAVKLSTLVTGNITTSSATVDSDKTFAPEGWKPTGVAGWVDRSGGIPLGYPRLTFQMRSPTKDSRVYKVSTKLFVPVLETIDPAVGIFGPKLAYDLQMHMDCLIPERATLAERTAFLSLIESLLSLSISASDGDPVVNTDSPTRAAILNLEDVY